MSVPPLSLRGIYGSLRVPTLRDLVYSSKAFTASALALMVGFSQDLDNPYWSVLSVYIIVNPPGAGAIRSKCVFRLLGTSIGGVLVIAATGMFGDQIGILLTAATAIIIGAMFLNQIDKTPSGYIWFAVAVTTAVIALNNLMHPDRIYELATARVQEISIGIFMTAVIDCFWPEPMTPPFMKTMAEWRGQARDFAVETVSSTEPSSDEERRGKLRDLIKGIQAIDAKAIQLPFDVVPRAPRGRDLDLVRRQVVATVGDLIALELRTRPLREGGVIPKTTQDRVEPVIAWLHAEPDLSDDALDTHIADGRALAREIGAAQADAGEVQVPATPTERDLPRPEAVDTREQVDPPLDQAHDPAGERWAPPEGLDEGEKHHRALMERGLLVRVGALLHDWCDLLLALRAVETGRRLPPRLEVIAARAKPVRSVDYLGTALDLAPLVLAMTVSSILWYLTAWENGPTALLFSFAGCIFLVGQAQILESTAGFLACVLIAFGLVFVYQFAVLPRVTDFPVLIMVLGCGLLPIGILMAMTMAGMLIAAFTLSFLGLQNAYHADLAQSLQTLVASMVGLLIAVTALRVCSYDHARFAAHRLTAAVRRDVLDVALASRLPGRDRFRFLALYRLSLYFPAAEQVAAGGPLPRLQLLDELVVGHNLLTLRRREATTSAGARDVLRALRHATAAAFQNKLAGRDDDNDLRIRVDAAMEHAAVRADPAREVLLDALAGLRLALSAPTHVHGTPAE